MQNYTNRFKENITFLDKIVSTLSYITFGLIGFIWIVFCYIRGENIKRFLKFNCYQSIALGLILYILQMAVHIFLKFIELIPFIGSQFINLLQVPIVAWFSLIQLIILLVTIYPAIWSIMGKYPKFPYISDHIDQI